jgi:hypothetical protein
MRRIELEDCTTEVAKEKDARGKWEWKLIRGCWPRGPLDREISGDIFRTGLLQRLGPRPSLPTCGTVEWTSCAFFSPIVDSGP